MSSDIPTIRATSRLTRSTSLPAPRTNGGENVLLGFWYALRISRIVAESGTVFPILSRDSSRCACQTIRSAR